MKILRTLVVSTLAIGLASGCAISYPENLSSIRSDVQSASGSGNVTVLLTDGTATLVGVVQSRIDAINAVNAARSAEGVNRVINRINVSN